MLNTYDYYAFGDDLTYTERSDNLYGFTGREFETGGINSTYYMRNRYYMAAIGVFMSRDDLAVDPFRGWRYAANSPLMLIDPYGKEWSFLQDCWETGLSLIGLGTEEVDPNAGSSFEECWGAVDEGATIGAFGVVDAPLEILDSTDFGLTDLSGAWEDLATGYAQYEGILSESETIENVSDFKFATYCGYAATAFSSAAYTAFIDSVFAESAAEEAAIVGNTAEEAVVGGNETTMGLWSGGLRAEEKAIQSGCKLVYNVKGSPGEALLEMYGESTDYTLMRPLWEAVSKDFVASHVGPVNIYLSSEAVPK